MGFITDRKLDFSGIRERRGLRGGYLSKIALSKLAACIERTITDTFGSARTSNLVKLAFSHRNL